MESCWKVDDWEAEAARRKERGLDTEVTHAPDCDGPVACGGTFRCSRCHLFFGWCWGAHEGEGDVRNDYCDECANAVTCRKCYGVLYHQGQPNCYGRCKNGCTPGTSKVKP